MNYLIYDKETKNTIRIVDVESIKYLVLNEGEAYTDLPIKEWKDNLNFYLPDGSIKPLIQQVKEGLIKLKEDEYVDEENNKIEKINTSDTEKNIDLMRRGLIEIPQGQKLEKTEDGNWYLRDKTKEEKLKDKEINKEEYNNLVIEERTKLYESNLDPLKQKLIYSFIKRLFKENNPLLKEEEKALIKEIEESKKSIKEANRKI